jgi:hypothetical protein
MADQDTTKTYVRDTRTTEKASSSLPLIVGGLVVAVFFVVWMVFGGDGPEVATTPAADTNVTVETPAAPADNTTNVTIDPAPEAAAPDAAVTPDATAPADGAEPAAPADGTAPATPPANP